MRAEYKGTTGEYKGGDRELEMTDSGLKDKRRG